MIFSLTPEKVCSTVGFAMVRYLKGSDLLRNRTLAGDRHFSKCLTIAPAGVFSLVNDMPIPTEKKCNRCHRDYPVDSFPFVWVRGRKYRRGVCGKCQNILYKTRYQKDENTRLARIARVALKYAVDNGIVIRPNRCSICGVPCKPEGHHSDILRKLKVVWMCRRCHLLDHQRGTDE